MYAGIRGVPLFGDVFINLVVGEAENVMGAQVGPMAEVEGLGTEGSVPF